MRVHVPFRTYVCFCVCICAHRFVQGCVNADVRACGGGCMHICMKSVRVSFLFLHHLHPGNLQWGWLACTAHTQTLVLLALLLLNPLLSNYWLLLNHVRDSLRGTRLLNSTKTIVKNCPEGLWTPRPGEGHFSPLIQTIYMYAG